MWHAWDTGEVRTAFWWGDLREREDLEDPVVDGRVILKCICRKWGGDARTGELFVVSAQCICVPVAVTTNSSCLLIEHQLPVLSLTYVFV
jgi:hypothetical protein